MAKDKLERFIDENRERFDAEEPRDETWSRVEQELNPGGAAQWSSFLWKAAAVVFFLSSAGLFLAGNFTGVEQLAEAPGQETGVDGAVDFSQVENYYMEQIREKRELVLRISNSEFFPNPATDLDLQRLDAMYKVLKEEYERNPTQGVKEALMLNLLIRTDILNDELARVEGLKNQDDVSS